ncbi:aminotransferase class III-fold pyridoxal phosphate-dependent enzyme [Actinoplanes sp. NPDC051851]|uniref:aminotransferase class III-fold pyridoxal phosphate-dependent enzyme n=1 Tax=Actinoplanes sp. NPDC051851 TaxID=3154753 RepID=UPI00344753E6
MSDLTTAARPDVTLDDAARIAAGHWGLSGEMRELGSHQDHNVRIDAPRGRFVLKIANAGWARSALDAQHAALPVIAAAGIPGPTPVGGIEQVTVAGQRVHAHVLTYVEGTPLLDRGIFGVDECRLLGNTAGRVVAALADFAHPGAERHSPWDLRNAAGVIDQLAPGLRAEVATHLDRIGELAARLPTQVIHGDLTDDNVVLADGAAGVIDFGDLCVSWRCAELAVTAASVIGKTGDDVGAVLAVVEAFTAHVPLTDIELTAVWPLVVLRGAVLVASYTEMEADGAENAYAQQRDDADRRAYQASAALDAEEMSWLIRGAGQPLPTLDLPRLLPGARPVALDVTSELWDDGAWLNSGVRPDATRYGEYRLDRARPLTAPGHHKVFTLGVWITLPEDAALPETPPGVIVDASGAPRIWVQACALPGTPPRTVTAHAEHLWRRICPDPSPLLGVDVAAPEPDPAGLLARRGAHFAAVQEHYYDAPPQIERGWREFLVDSRANVYLDLVNNVATTGHAHPHLSRAASRQWRLLNTNSRFHYEQVVTLCERLAGLAPDGLDQVFLVNSGSEAVDLAMRLALTATGRTRMLAAREAYHGNTIGSDAVTSSIGDNPHALETRPAWVELIDAPNRIRGTHRGPDAGRAYLADLDAQLGRIDTTEIAGVILEPLFGNGGGVLLPEGYLAGVFDRVRALGGVCISDEVQVGYGRLGHHFWGFEQQGAVPDIITIAKAMGNGQPLGAVITTRAIADAFAAEGSFFSSAGGSPVSAAVGNAVLDVMADERLQENARIVGTRLKDGLDALAVRHPAIGAVHGMGLYLGVELVTDRETFAPATELAHAVCEAMREEGCIVQPTGDLHNVLKIKPPMVISAESVDYALAALGRVLSRL